MAAHANFREDLRQGNFLSMAEVPLHDLLNRSEDMARRHTARHGFRTYDVLHVASAILLDCEALWSFDERARRLARLEGLATN